MIKMITVENYVGDTLKLDLFNPEESGFVIREVTGLGPVNATINTSEAATMDGTWFNSARSEQRNIVFSLTFLPCPTIEDARLKSYKYFPNKKPVTITVETDKRKAYVVGYVETNEPNIFDKEEGCEISIICPDPYFYSVTDQETVFSGVEPLFKFEFSNESTEDPLINLGEIVHYRTRSIVYKGDAEVGVTITIHVLGAFTNLTLFNLNTDGSMTIDTEKIAKIIGSSIKPKDDIILDTRRGKKSMKLIRDGKTYNIISALGRDIEWLSLELGSNDFHYAAETGENNFHLSISNNIVYEGV